MGRYRLYVRKTTFYYILYSYFLNNNTLNILKIHQIQFELNLHYLSPNSGPVLQTNLYILPDICCGYNTHVVINYCVPSFYIPSTGNFGNFLCIHSKRWVVGIMSTKIQSIGIVFHCVNMNHLSVHFLK